VQAHRSVIVNLQSVARVIHQLHGHVQNDDRDAGAEGVLRPDCQPAGFSKMMQLDAAQ
jgi:hypothetical protein